MASSRSTSSKTFLLCAVLGALLGLCLSLPPGTAPTVSDHVDTGGQDIGTLNISSADPGPVDEEHTDSAMIPVTPPSDITNKATAPLVIRAASLMLAPYHMSPGPHSPAAPNSGPHIGFIPELLVKLEKKLSQTYPVTFQLYLPADARYGSNVNGTWTGLIGELVKKSKGDAGGADMAAFPIMMTSERQKVATFLNPFQHGGLTAIIKKPHLDNSTRDPIESTFFNVIRPLGTDVWITIVACFLVVSGMLWLLNFFNPYEWGARYNLGRAPEAAAESFKFTGALWFTFTTLQWQGFDRMPRATSSKVLTLFWFTFVSITIIMYTAGVVNNVFWASTVHGKDLRVKPFSDVSHLVWTHDHTGYDYGVVAGGAAHSYIMSAPGPHWDVMRAYLTDPKNGGKHMAMSVEHGMQKVHQGKYALITDTLLARYLTNQKPCETTVLDGAVGRRSYGMAVRKDLNPALLEALRVAILELTESGDIKAMENKWWSSYGDCWDQTEIEEEVSSVATLLLNTPKQITFSMFWGPLLIISFGVLISICIGVAELMYYRQKGRYERSNRPGGQRLGNEETT